MFGKTENKDPLWRWRFVYTVDQTVGDSVVDRP